jgi:hypothetical protein
MSTRTSSGLGRNRGFLLLPLALVLFLPALFHSAGAQQQLAPGARPPTTQAPAPLAGAPPLVPAPAPSAPGAPTTPGVTPPPAASALPPVAVDWGLCQCIGDKTALEFTCPGSVEACQSACGTQYSFKPDARCRTAAATH